ncbi:MAG: peptidoglycan DD-metalloendopeptidase family protein [Paludibacteraceae bacterium]|nr:peptidoglycan DD-metalloendopeptidase family protein [Paludibacteraceae bacterium]
MKKILILHIILLITAVLPAQTVKELQKQQRELQQQLEQTSNMLKQTKQSETATINKLNLLNNDIKTRKKLIKNIQSEISGLNTEMVQLRDKRSELQIELEACKADYARLIRETHYADMQQSPLLFLLSSNTFQQLTRRIRYMQQFAAYRKEQAREIERIQTEIDHQNEQLEKRKNDRSKALKNQKREQDNLAIDERKQKKMLESLKKQEKELLAKQKEQQKKANALNKQIEDLIAKQVRTTTTLTKEQKLIAGGFEANQGRMPWPVEKGYISGHFGKHKHPVHEHVTIDNKGIYLQTVNGASARAIYEGEVTWCAQMNGNYAVIIQHGNYRTVYSPLKSITVKQGDKVTAKQAIGTIYTDSSEDNKTELYFQLYKDRSILNPSLWLAQ